MDTDSFYLFVILGKERVFRIRIFFVYMRYSDLMNAFLGVLAPPLVIWFLPGVFDIGFLRTPSLETSQVFTAVTLFNL